MVRAKSIMSDAPGLAVGHAEIDAASVCQSESRDRKVTHKSSGERCAPACGGRIPCVASALIIMVTKWSRRRGGLAIARSLSITKIDSRSRRR